MSCPKLWQFLSSENKYHKSEGRLQIFETEKLLFFPKVLRKKENQNVYFTKQWFKMISIQHKYSTEIKPTHNLPICIIYLASQFPEYSTIAQIIWKYVIYWKLTPYIWYSRHVLTLNRCKVITSSAMKTLCTS